MIVLFTTVALASLLGSLHCAGMCGPLAAFATGPRQRGAAATAGIPLRVLNASRGLIAYNLGRLIVYSMLGTISGALGAAVDLGGALVGAQRIAATAAGSMLVAFGLATLASAAGIRLAIPALPAGLQRLSGRVHGNVAAWRPPMRAAAIGLLSGLLPCGWLYAFVLIAGGTANPVLGAATMVAFWLGTLPVMLSIGFGLQTLLGALRSRAPIVTSLALVAIGLLTVFVRIELPSASFARSLAKPADIGQAIDAASAADSARMPCCHAEGAGK